MRRTVYSLIGLLLIQVDANGFIIAEPATARQFLPKHYLFPLPLQQIQLSKGTLDQNTGW